jgi:tetratricopeptide (TPR) repeat protein
LLFIFGLFFYFNKNHIPEEKKSVFLIRLNLVNVIFYGLITLASQCLEISYIDLSKHLSAAFLFITIIYSISSYADLRLFIKIFAYFNQAYILITMCYYFYFKFIEGVFFSGICYTMFYPYYYAALVICLTPLSLYLYFTSETQNPKEKANFLILFLLCCLNVFLTSSRVAQITLCLSIFAVLYYFNRFIEFKPKIKFIAVIFCAALLAGGLFTTDAYSRIAKSFTSSENFDLHDENGRFNIYKGALKTFLDYPLTGTGPALSSLFITKYRVSKLCITDCHNIILNRLCETGIFYTIFSFLTLLITIGFTVKYILLNPAAAASPDGGHSATALKAAAAACAIALAAIYLQGFSMPHSFLTSLIYLEYIIIALCVSAVKISCAGPYTIQNQDADNTLFSFTKKNMRLSTLFSVLIVFNILIIFFTGDKIIYFMQWFMNLSFLLISVMVFIAHHYGGLTKLFIKNAALKCIICALVITQLIFQWRIFESGISAKSGINHNMAGDNKQALECFEKSAGRYPNMASYLFLSALYFNAGETDKAYNAAVFYNSKLPYEIFGLNNLAGCLIKKGHLTEAADAYDKLDRYSAKNYMSAPHGAFLIMNNNIKAGLEKYSRAAVENPEFLSNKYFCSELLTDPALINNLYEKITADAGVILTTKEKFISHYLNALSDVFIALRTYGYECGNDNISDTKIYKNKFIKTCTDGLDGVLPAMAGLLTDFNSLSKFNPVKTYMRGIQKYKNYEIYKKNIASSSINHSAHFGLKHWFDFENALIDPQGVFEPAPAIPLFITIILEKTYPPELVKKFAVDFYGNFYHTKIRHIKPAPLNQMY